MPSIITGRRGLIRLGAGVLAMPAIWPAHRARAAQAALEPVDVELVLAVDVSRSVDAEEQALQFEGYAKAFRDPRLAAGIARGDIGAIAVSFFTWSDWDVQNLLVPWSRIDGPASAARFADALDAAPRETFLYTSISGALDYAAKLFGQGFEGTRQVVDVSGDGINNSGRPLAKARAEALERGIVVNGLAVVDRTPAPTEFTTPPSPLDEYYRDEVIGGPGSFLMVAEGFTAFEGAVRRKIIREIALHAPAGPRVERQFA